MTEPRRISPPREYEPLIDKLVDNGVFETKQAAMMFAAALGKRFAGRKPRGSPGDGIRWYIFEKAGDEAFVNSLALAEKNSNSGSAHRAIPAVFPLRLPLFFASLDCVGA